MLLRSITLLLCCCVIVHASDDEAWHHDLGSALDASEQTPVRPLALLFSGENCAWCHRMLDESAQDPAAIRALERVVGVVIDIQERPDLAARFQVRGVPAMVLINRNREFVRRVDGYLPVEDLVTTLRVLDLHGEEEGLRPVVFDHQDAIADALDSAAPERQLVDLLVDADRDLRQQLRAVLAQHRDAEPLLWESLTHERLGVRVDASAILARWHGSPKAYDPFAPLENRQRLAAAWRRQATGAHGSTPEFEHAIP